MNRHNSWKIHIPSIAVIALVLVVSILSSCSNEKKDRGSGNPASEQGLSHGKSPAVSATSRKTLSDLPKPKLLELGSHKCIPCKMMEPILADLKKNYADKLEVEFIDVWKVRSASRKYGIRVIPTQIFFSPDGKELFRHRGFMPKKDILAKWKELGYDLEKS